MSIYSDIVIQSGGTLNITGATIGIISGGHIYIENGGYLNITSSILTNACTYMWGGILNKLGGKLVISYSLLENAEYAVELQPLSYTYLEKVNFDKDYVGIYTKPSLSPVVFTSFYMNDVSFTCTGSLIANTVTTAAKTFAGIYFNNTNAVIEGAVDKLTFNDLNNGICAVESNIDIKNSYFEKIQPDPVYANFFDGSAIYANGGNGNYFLSVEGLGFSYTITTMNSCKYGVYAVTINADVFNCKMDDMEEGINVYKCPDKVVLISGNIIYASKYGMNLLYNDFVHNMIVRNNAIFMNWTGGTSGGIGMNVLDKGNGIAQNKFFIDNSVSSYSAYGGVLMTNVNYSFTNQCDILFYSSIPEFGWKYQGGKGNQIKCSSVTKDYAEENTKNCLYCFVESGDPLVQCNVGIGGEVGMRFTGNCGVVNLIENTFIDNLDAGLYLNSTAIIGAQSDKLNKWVNTTSSTVAICNSCPYNLSLFEVQNYSPYLPDIIIPASGWFGLIPNMPILRCSDVCLPDLALNDSITTEEQYLLDNGTLGLSEYSLEIDEFVRQEIFMKISRMDASLLTPQLTDFYNAHLSGDLYSYQAMKDALSVNVVTPADQISLAANINDLKLEINESNSIGKLLLDSSISQLEKDSLSIVLTSKLTTIESKYNENIAIVDPVNLQVDNLNASAEMMNSGISTSEIIYANQKQVDEIYLQTVAIGNYHLTASQIDVLEYIANQCPLAGGDAVFQARGLLSLSSHNMYYDDNTACSVAGISFRKRSVNGIGVSLFPNPATDKVQIKIISGIDQKYVLDFSNLLGEIVKSVSLSGNIIDQQIDLTDLAQGVYMYTLSAPNEKLNGYIIRN